MSITERRLRQKEEVRRLIIETAWNIVLNDGWQSLSIRKLADAIEYSVPVIYDHFVNKEAIQVEFTKRGFQLLNTALKKAKERHSNPVEQINAIALAYLDFETENKEYYQLMFGVGIPRCEIVDKVPEIHSFTEIILEPLRVLIKKSKSKDIDPELKLQTFWSMLLGLVAMENVVKIGDVASLKSAIVQDFMRAFIMGINE
jgi:AcrR family transcriptional regulator